MSPPSRGAGTPRPRPRRLLGAFGGQGGQGRRRNHRHRTAGRHRNQQRRRNPGAGRRRDDLFAADGQPGRGGGAPAVREERGDAGRLVVPERAKRRSDAEAALEGNATLHGTGMAPGGISEKFPLLFSAFSTGVTFVRAEEFSDLRTYEAPDVLRHVMGFGELPEKALTGPMQKMLDSGFIQAVRMCVDKLGFNADPKVRASQEVAVASAPIDSPLGTIEPGQVAGRKFHWEALVDGEPVVRVTVNWLMGEENLDPAWTLGPAGQRYEMEVRGNPDITIVVKGFHSEVGGEGPEHGIVGTAAHCVNSVPAVCAAEPGILTYLDLPLISGKAAPPLG